MIYALKYPKQHLQGALKLVLTIVVALEYSEREVLIITDAAGSVQNMRSRLHYNSKIKIFYHQKRLSNFFY